MARKNRTIAASAVISGHCALTTLLPQEWRILPSFPPWAPPLAPAAAPRQAPLPMLLSRLVPGVPSASCFSVELTAIAILQAVAGSILEREIEVLKIASNQISPSALSKGRAKTFAVLNLC